MLRESEAKKYETVLDQMVWMASVNAGTSHEYQMGDEWVGLLDEPKRIMEWIDENPGPMEQVMDTEDRAIMAAAEAIIIHVDGDDFVHIAYFGDAGEAGEVWSVIEDQYFEEFEGQEDEIG